MRGCGMMGEHLQRFHAFALAALFELLPEHDLLARLMPALIEFEFSTLLRLLDGPSGKHLRQFGYVLLRVAAVNAQRMEFHNLACVVFIQSAGTLCLLLCCLLGSGPRGIVNNHSKRTSAQPSTSGKSSPVLCLI